MFENMLGDVLWFSWFFRKDGIKWAGFLFLSLFLTKERTRLSLVSLILLRVFRLFRLFWLQATVEGEHDKSIRIAGVLASNASNVFDEGFEADALAFIDWQFVVL